MKRYLVFLPCVFLFGCVSVPVQRNFPNVPAQLQVTPTDLKEVPAGATASSTIDVVIENYGTYYEVTEQLKGWQQWYIDQKKIFESVQ